MQYKRFEEHFWKLQNKLKNGENFAFSRYSDGEMNIMQNQHLVLDNKSTRLDGKCVGMKYDDIGTKYKTTGRNIVTWIQTYERYNLLD